MTFRIFVPLDGSQRAEQALPVAARIARNTGGAVVLARVVSIVPEVNPYYAMPAAESPTLVLEVLDAAKDYLTQLAHSDVLKGIDSAIVVLTGPAAHVLLEEIGVQKADLVVMTSHGRTGLSRWVLGSTAQHIARHAKVPVLVMRENVPLIGEIDATDRVLRVLVPLDGSRRAEVVIRELGNLLDSLRVSGGAEVHLVHVIVPFELKTARIEENVALAGANAYLKRIAEQFKATYPHAGIKVTWSVVENDDVADALITMADSGAGMAQMDISASYDMVAMATHGRTGLARWALGSVTERMFGSISMPFLIVRPPDITLQQIPDDMREHAAMSAPL